MPQEITKPTPLLKEDDSTVVGWASSNLLDYNKIDCAAPLARIKEWDRYTVVSPDCAVTLSIADLGNLGYIFASLTDFTQKPCRTFSQTITRAYPRGRMSLPLSARSGDTTYTSKQVGMRFSRSAKSRFLNCEYVNFCEGKTLYLNLSLDEPDRYAIASADDFGGKKGCFSYRYQVSCMPASGVIRYGGAEYSFRPESSFGTLSWCRGVFPTRAGFTSATLVGQVKQVPFALFAGGPLESALYYGDQFYKLDEINVFPEENGSWQFRFPQSGSRLEMSVLQKNEVRSSFLMNFCRHEQVFGSFNGKLSVPGQKLSLDHISGFTEQFESRL